MVTYRTVCEEIDREVARKSYDRRRLRRLLVALQLICLAAVALSAQAPAAAPPSTSDALFTTTKVWNVHLTFADEAWRKLVPPPAPPDHAR